jgi:hypothetical protein
MKIKIKGIGLLLIIIFGFSNHLKFQNRNNTTITNKNSSPTMQYENENNPKSSSTLLIDKVFQFIAPKDSIIFNSLLLEYGYTYWIYIELVTPDVCDNLKIWFKDPIGRKFEIFDAPLNYFYEYARYYSIPFGTAMNGTYILNFTMTMPEPLNMLIRLEKGLPCLNEKIDWQYIDNNILVEFKTFKDIASVERNIMLNTDIMHKFFIGRISPITVNISCHPVLTVKLIDPMGIIYKIYDRLLFPSVDEIVSFEFGTHITGVYSINFTFTNITTYFNVGYLVAEDYQISEIITGNETTTNSTNETIFSIRDDLVLTTLSIIGCLFGFLFIGLVYNRRKNSVNLDMNKK